MAHTHTHTHTQNEENSPRIKMKRQMQKMSVKMGLCLAIFRMFKDSKIWVTKSREKSLAHKGGKLRWSLEIME